MGRTSGGQHVFEETLELNSGKIAFPVIQAASTDVNTLDDYQEGTWTPSIADATLDGSGEGQVYSVQVGTYTKIGDRVFFNFHVNISDLGTLTTSEAATVMGLPFTVKATGREASISIGIGVSLAISAGQTVTGFGNQNAATIRLELWDATAGTSVLLISELSAGGVLFGAGHFEVA